MRTCDRRFLIEARLFIDVHRVEVRRYNACLLTEIS